MYIYLYGLAISLSIVCERERVSERGTEMYGLAISLGIVTVGSRRRERERERERELVRVILDMISDM